MTKAFSESQRYLVKVVWLCVICSFFFVASVSAQTDEELPSSIVSPLTEDLQNNTPPIPEAENLKAGSPSWTPPSAPPDKFDWIQLTSGEWLKGELNVFHNHKLEFDSDELDLLEFDWEDVKQVRGHRLHSVRFEGPITVVGMLKVIDNRVFITTEDQVLEFDRARIVSIAPGGPRRINYWSAKLSFALDVRQGNSEQINYSTTAYVKRRTSGSSFSLDYLGIFNQTEGIETANSQRVNSYYESFRTRKFSWRLLFGEYFRDPFQNLAHRATVGSGLTYHIIHTTKTEWNISPGLGYQYVQNVSVDPEELNGYTSTPALVLDTVYDTELTRKIDLNASYQCYFVNEDAGRYTHHAVATVELELTRRLDFDVSFVWDRIQDPKTAADGRVPKQDDFYMFLGIGFEL